MPHLTATAVKNARPGDTPRKVYDTLGMFLYITPAGAKTWRLRYRFDGKDSQIVLGTFPELSLAEAREKRDEARKLLRAGKNPSAERKAEKVARHEAKANLFGAVAREWLESCRAKWHPTSTKRIEIYLKHLHPLDRVPISQVTPRVVLRVVLKIAEGEPGKKKGGPARIVTAQKCLRAVGAIMRHAVAHGRAEIDPTPSLKGALPAAPPPDKRAAFRHLIDEPRKLATAVADLMRKIDGYGRARHGEPQRFSVTRSALLILAHTLVRSNELRGARWDEVDFDAAQWVIPAARMKGRLGRARAHTIPLSTQMLAMLRELKTHTGHREHLFPNARDPKKYMSPNTLSGALRILEIPGDLMSPHGFRTVGSAMLNADAWRADVIEATLAHIIPGVRGIYAATTFIEERKQLMQAWSDKLDALRDGTAANVVAIGRGKVA